MKIVVKSTKTISFDENFDDDGSSSENKSADSNKDSDENDQHVSPRTNVSVAQVTRQDDEQQKKLKNAPSR